MVIFIKINDLRVIHRVLGQVKSENYGSCSRKLLIRPGRNHSRLGCFGRVFGICLANLFVVRPIGFVSH